MDTVVEDEEMENKILAENQSQIMESEQSDTEQVKILQTDKKNDVSEIMDQNKVMQTTSENANLEGQNEDDKKSEKIVMSPGTEVCHGDKDLMKSHPIIEGMEVVMVSRIMDGEYHSKNETNLMENEPEKATEMHVKEVIEGKL